MTDWCSESPATSAGGNPEFGTVLNVARALGLKLTVTPA
jgi:DNA-binding phage protein